MTRRIELPFKVRRPILALGADLKGAFAVAYGREAILVDGFGDLSDPDNFTIYEKAVKSELKKLKIKPGIAACDLHPGYFSTHFAEEINESHPFIFPFIPNLIRVQHHEAHIASAIVDHAIKGKVIGVALDGTGYGSDGFIWGGEFFVGDLKNFHRAAHFEYVAMPGGDKAIREPWRMAVSYLYQAFGKRAFNKRAFGKKFLKLKPNFLKNLQKRCQAPLLKMIDKNINSPLTSSVGRLFDAVGSIVLSKPNARYEAELPIALEKLADRLCGDRYDFGICKEGGLMKIDSRKIIEGIMGDMRRGVNKGLISGKFHNTISVIIVRMALTLSNKYKSRNIVLSGGVFQNRFLTKRITEMLAGPGPKAWLHSKVPTNDSGIPIGQIAIANARVKCA
ncbi:MAG: hypothetical protein V1927_06000 [Candidatus Omnitrophota bacterium]